MSLDKLCYLWTFILSLTNLTNITDISWLIVLAPTVILWGLAAFIILVAVIAAVVLNNK